MGKTSKTLADMDKRLMGLEAASRERVENEQALQRRVAKLASDGGEYYKLINAQAHEHARLSTTVGDIFERIDDLRGRVEELGKWAHPPVDFQPMLDRLAALEETSVKLNDRVGATDDGLRAQLDGLTFEYGELRRATVEITERLERQVVARTVNNAKMRETSEEAVRHAAACIGAVGVLRALADYLGKGHALADTLTSATDYALKIRILNEAIEKVEAL